MNSASFLDNNECLTLVILHCIATPLSNKPACIAMHLKCKLVIQRIK